MRWNERCETNAITAEDQTAKIVQRSVNHQFLTLRSVVIPIYKTE